MMPFSVNNPSSGPGPIAGKEGIKMPSAVTGPRGGQGKRHFYALLPEPETLILIFSKTNWNKQLKLTPRDVE